MKNISYTSLVLGIIVVVIVAALLITFVRQRTAGPGGLTLPGIQTEEQKQAEQQKTELPTTHKVLEGETLWTIAEKYYQNGFNWVDIASENNLVNPNALEVGMELKIPKVEAKTPVPTGQEEQVMTGAAIQEDSYTVVRDDNLWDISVRAYGDGFKWTEVAQANNLVNPNLIHAGNVLKLPR